MNIRATRFVMNLRGMSADEKAVALVMAGHADAKTAAFDASMTTIAEESGFSRRATASNFAKKFEVSYGIIKPIGSHSGGRRPTKYAFTFGCNPGSALRLCTPRNRTPISGQLNADEPYAPERTVESAQPYAESASTVRVEHSNRTPAGVHEGFEGFKGGDIVGGCAKKSSSSGRCGNHDDDDFLRNRENPTQNPKPLSHVDQLIEKAKHQLIRVGEDPELVEAALALISARATEHHTEPATPKYFVQAYWTLSANANELAVLRFQIEQKHENSRKGKSA